jgi:GT2 family glycosyltransferase
MTCEISVLFATRNGGERLKRTLEGYVCQRNVSFPWKITVVDNGSVDGTANILQSFRSRLPLSVKEEMGPGKNRALNSGLMHLEGRLCIFSDDDAIPDITFLKSWHECAGDHGEFSLFGGVVRPLFEVPPPAWMARRRPQFGPLFAERDLPEGPIAPTEIFGPNMAVRRSVLDAGLSFNPNIGPNGGDPFYPMGSETEFCVRAATLGFRSWFTRGPIVSHIVRENQMQPDFWFSRAYRHGRGFVQLQMEAGAIDAKRRRSMVRRLATWLRVFTEQSGRRASALSPSPLMRFNAAWNYHWRRGYQDEMAKLRS